MGGNLRAMAIEWPNLARCLAICLLAPPLLIAISDYASFTAAVEVPLRKQTSSRVTAARGMRVALCSPPNRPLWRFTAKPIRQNNLPNDISHLRGRIVFAVRLSSRSQKTQAGVKLC